MGYPQDGTADAENTLGIHTNRIDVFGPGQVLGEGDCKIFNSIDLGDWCAIKC